MSIIDPAVRQIQGAVARVAIFEVISQLTNALLDANTKTAKALDIFAQVLADDFGNIESRLGQVNAQIAEEAHEAVIEAYTQARSEGTHSSPYRANVEGDNHRYAGGVLQGAIASAGFIEGDADGIHYGNLTLLDDVARQWARLNFGAGGAAGGAPSPVTVRWSNLDSFVLGIDESPRPGFTIPRGYWLSGNEFFPMGSLGQGYTRKRMLAGGGVFQRQKATKGIRGEHWIEAGFDVIGERIGPAYLEVLRRIFEEAKNAGQSQVYGASRLGRPRSSISGGYRAWRGTR